MDDETLLKTMKNGLMIAGHEMGPVGDHWPALNAIIDGLDREFTEHSANEAVVGELEFHFAEALRGLEELAAAAENANDRDILMAVVKDAWERYYAILEPVDAKNETQDIEDLVPEGGNSFPNMKAATHILKHLGSRTWQ